VVPYWAARVDGATTAAAVRFVVASGQAAFTLADGFAANGYGAHSLGGYWMTAALVVGLLLTAGFFAVILGATSPGAPKGFAPLAIGLALTLIHLVSIPVTNTSVNPARSTGQALLVGGWATAQLWLFWTAPLAGALVAGLVHRLAAAGPTAPLTL
jgi:aquaporin Z